MGLCRPERCRSAKASRSLATTWEDTFLYNCEGREVRQWVSHDLAALQGPRRLPPQAWRLSGQLQQKGNDRPNQFAKMPTTLGYQLMRNNWCRSPSR